MIRDLATWTAIALCASQAFVLSGLNLASFSVSRLRLEAEAASGERRAQTFLELRADSNFLLTTILWGNVAVNCLLTLLADSILPTVAAFVFSTIVITFIGEIFPQAWFSRHAVRMVAACAPLLRAYQIVLYPLARPTARLLDRWVGPEGVQYFRERDLREIIRMHMGAEEAEIGMLEGMGAINFLALDDLPAVKEGEPLDPESVLSLPVADGVPVFPPVERSTEDPFLRAVLASGKKWAVVVDPEDQPVFVLNTNAFLRAALSGEGPVEPLRHGHAPVVVRDPETPLGRVLPRLRVQLAGPADDVIHEDVVLLWGPERRILTGADILGRLLRGIVPRVRTSREEHG